MIWTVVGAVSGILAVALGAFAAHGLHGRLSPEALATFDTGARYQLAHALALVALGFGADRLRPGDARTVGTLFAAGSVLFAGSPLRARADGRARLGRRDAAGRARVPGRVGVARVGRRPRPRAGLTCGAGSV